MCNEADTAPRSRVEGLRVSEASAPAPSAPGGTLLTSHDPGSPPLESRYGPYRVQVQQGVGVLGPVFRGYDARTGESVAIKVFRLDLVPERARALAEALTRLASRGVAHPSLASPLAAGLADTVPYLVYEYVEGDPLDVGPIAQGESMSVALLRLARTIGDAGRAAERCDVVHGALHPRDVLVTPHGPVVTGFGVAGALASVGLSCPIRRPYSAPEVVGGAAPTPASDEFSLASMLYEMATGRRLPAFGADAAATLRDGVALVERPWIEAFGRALSERPEDRYGSMTAFGDALHDGAGSQVVTALHADDFKDQADEDSEEAGLDAFPESESLPPRVRAAPGPTEVEFDWPAPSRSDASAVEPGAGENAEDMNEEPEAAAPHPIIVDAFDPADGDADPLDEFASGPSDEPVHVLPARAEVEVPPSGDRGDHEDDLELGHGVADGAERVEEVRVLDPLDDPVVAAVHEPPSLDPIDVDTPYAPAPPPSRARSSRSGRIATTLAAGIVLGALGGYWMGLSLAGPDAGDDLVSIGDATPEPLATPGSSVQPEPLTAPEPSAPTPDAGGDGRAATGSADEALAQASPDPVRPGAQAVEEEPLRVPREVPVAAGGPAPEASAPEPESPPQRAQDPPAPSAAVEVVNDRESASATSGRLLVRSSPAGASVRIDGRYWGDTPLVVRDLAFGTRLVEVNLAGYVPAAQRLSLSSARPALATTFQLVEVARGAGPPPGSRALTAPSSARPASRLPTFAPAPASLSAIHIVSRPTGATVVVDGQLIGTTPLLMGDVAVGQRTVRLEHDGYRPWTSVVMVTPGERARVAASMEPQTP